MHRVLVTRALPDGVLDGTDGWELVGPPAGDVPMTKAELVAAAGEVDAIICLLTDRIDRDVLAAGRGRLAVVANVAVGYDNIDLAAADDCGVIVTNTPGVLDETTADLAFLLLLAASRLATTAEADLRAGRWPGWGITQYLGRDVHGATLGVVGWGRIGQALARRASAFDMPVLHHARNPTGEAGYLADLDELLTRSDAVSLHVPLTADTRGLMDEARIGAMKAGAVLINTARGGIVDEVALAHALRQGRLGGAALDVFEHEPLGAGSPLAGAPNLILTPHIGGVTRESNERVSALVAEKVAAHLAALQSTEQPCQHLALNA